MQALWIVLALIALGTAAVLAYLLLTRFIPTMEGQNKRSQQGVVKHDWLSTGRIDFATRLDATEQNKDQQDEFKLLVEERRVVESLAGNENLEIQWRLATLSEAKAVVTQYHKYLSDNSLIKSIPDTPVLLSSPPMAPRGSLVQPESNIVASSDGSGPLSH
jgi:hypothetical protein